MAVLLRIGERRELIARRLQRTKARDDFPTLLCRRGYITNDPEGIIARDRRTWREVELDARSTLDGRRGYELPGRAVVKAILVLRAVKLQLTDILNSGGAAEINRHGLQRRADSHGERKGEERLVKASPNEAGIRPMLLIARRAIRTDTLEGNGATRYCGKGSPRGKQQASRG